MVLKAELLHDHNGRMVLAGLTSVLDLNLDLKR